MKKTFLTNGATFLALIGSGFIINSGPAVAQQGEAAMEEIVVVEAPLEGRVVGRSGIGAEIKEFELKRPVSYADLNLCQDADAATLQTRIEDTANAVCKELSEKFPLDPADRNEIFRCTKSAVDGAQAQREAAVANAKSDSDGDGVLNCMDQCTGTPANSPVDKSGCPLPQSVEKAVELKGVNFEFDSSELTADSTMALDGAVETLKQNPDMAVEIAGHTDSQGSDEYNQGLSERRAQAVFDYLVGHGVNGDKLSARGYGESEPVADNGTEEGRAANRRIELRKK